MKQPIEKKISLRGLDSFARSTARSRNALITENELRAYCLGAKLRGSTAGQQLFVSEMPSDGLHRTFGYRTPKRKGS